MDRGNVFTIVVEGASDVSFLSFRLFKDWYSQPRLTLFLMAFNPDMLRNLHASMNAFSFSLSFFYLQ